MYTRNIAPEERPKLPRPFPVRAMLETEPAPRDWVLPGLPLGKAGLLIAPGGTGKSKFLLELAMGIALGLAWPLPEEVLPPAAPAPVLLLVSEDEEVDIHHRLWPIAQALGLSDEQRQLLVENLRIQPTAGLRLAEHCGLMRHGPLVTAVSDAVAARPPRLIVGDPLSRLADWDEVTNRAATRVVEVVEELARTTGSSVVIAHHTGKAAMRNGELAEQHAARGASALTDGVRWQAHLCRMSKATAAAHGIDEESARAWVQFSIAKSNYAATTPALWLRYGAGGVLVPDELPTSTRRSVDERPF